MPRRTHGGIAADHHAGYRPGEFQSNHCDARKTPPPSHTTTRMRRSRRTQQDAGYKRRGDATTVLYPTNSYVSN
jgi:hypothetical protein